MSLTDFEDNNNPSLIMTVTQDLSFVSLISNASLLVQLVMALLALVSLMSWFYIFRKLFSVRNAKRQTAEFEAAFWSGANLNALYEEVTASRRRTGGGALERIFEAGMEEYKKARVSFGGKNIDTGVLIDGARRAMRAAYQVALCGAVRYGVGHHEFFPRPRQRTAGYLSSSCARYCGSLDCHRDWLVRSHPRSRCLQPLFA